jgi:glycosyltransferase involved in cell wall biosynthesis
MSKRLEREVADFDLVHIHSLWLFPQFAAQRAAQSAGVPYVVSPHGALDPYLRRHGRVRKAVTDLAWQRRMLIKATMLHITTAQEGELIADIAPRTPREIVPVGISIERLLALGDASRFRRKHLGGRSGDIVLFLGRLTYKKGIDVLIRSFTHVAREIEDATLVVAGPDDEHLRPRLEKIVRAEGLDDRVVFPGPLYQEDRSDAFAASAAWALSSYTENFGVAVMEALAVGLPTIISTEVNLADAIRRTDAGVVAGLDPEEFGGALLDLLRDHALRAGLADRGRAFAAGYDWSAVAPQLEAMYRRAVSSDR